MSYGVCLLLKVQLGRGERGERDRERGRERRCVCGGGGGGGRKENEREVYASVKRFWVSFVSETDSDSDSSHLLQ